MMSESQVQFKPHLNGRKKNEHSPGADPDRFPMVLVALRERSNRGLHYLFNHASLPTWISVEFFFFLQACVVWTDGWWQESNCILYFDFSAFNCFDHKAKRTPLCKIWMTFCIFDWFHTTENYYAPQLMPVSAAQNMAACLLWHLPYGYHWHSALFRDLWWTGLFTSLLFTGIIKWKKCSLVYHVVRGHQQSGTRSDNTVMRR